MSAPRYSSAAHNDLNEILHYIAVDKPDAARAWVDKLEAKCRLISENPEMGELRPEYGEGVRSVSVGRYVIFHRRKQGCVEIVRIIPGDRNIRFLL